MFMRFTVLFCVTVFFIMVCYANPEEQPCIRRIQDLRIDTNQHETIYIQVLDLRGNELDNVTIYKSLNAGKSWLNISSTDHWVGDIVVNPKDSQIIYFGNTAFKSYFGNKSTDNGRNWSKIDVAPRLIHPQDTAIMYATSPLGLRKSIDGGTGWIDLKGDWAGCREIVLAHQNPNILYAHCWGGSSDGIFKSSNAGASWSIVLPVTSVWNLAIDPNNSEIVYAGTRFHGVYRSMDGGKKWDTVNRGLPKGMPDMPWDYETRKLHFSKMSAYESIRRLVIDPIRSSILYIGTPSGVFKSIDRGANWRGINKGLPDRFSVSALAIDPKNSDILYIGTWSRGVFKSIDGGENWVPASEGIACGQPINIW